MADRIRVISFIGVTPRLERPGERPRPTSRGGSGILHVRARPTWSATRSRFAAMARSRVYGILAGYEGHNDHDTFRSDVAPLLRRSRPAVWRRQDAARRPLGHSHHGLHEG